MLYAYGEVVMMRIGDVVKPRELAVVAGGTVRVPAGDRLTHLQFRRFAGCPVCNLHLRSIVRRHDEIEAAGVREVVFFHSPEAQLRAYAPELPFVLVADPEKRFYREFGVQSGRRALLAPRAWPAIVRGIVTGLAHRDSLPAMRQDHGRLGLPADFLLAGDGRVLALKYGTHAYDQWSVDDLLDLARRGTRVP